MLNEGPSVMTGQLYNVMEDPSEKNDLWEKEPGVVKELGAILEKCKSVAATNKIQNFQIHE
jgi:hypothetical protein